MLPAPKAIPSEARIKPTRPLQFAFLSAILANPCLLDEDIENDEKAGHPRRFGSGWFHFKRRKRVPQHAPIYNQNRKKIKENFFMLNNHFFLHPLSEDIGHHCLTARLHGRVQLCYR
jgi:hypothetical protein